MHDQFHTDCTALKGLEFSPADSLSTLHSVSGLLDRINGVRGITLPKDMTDLTMAQTRQYYQVEEFNLGARDLYSCAGPIIDTQPSVAQCMTRLQSLTTADTEACAQLDRETEALLTRLHTLASDQTTSSALLSQLESTSVVTESEVEERQYEVDLLQFKLGRKKGLSPEEKASLQSEIDTSQQRVDEMVRSQETRTSLLKQLSPYSHLPKVASALGVPLSPSPTLCDEEVCSGVGMMVKAVDA
ncbi:hypothetical protein KIPB_003788 [Kipferlia bialata]|uniref:Uncharacterized protein n=1 Tax=Kipferlia bialata TaxID=797122 RepID=A0A9K3CSZ1_9EUKA|nr:hypothetical protein KIPB_003788 [Kipferlia bialata]|eukprot:g3788.t1